MTHSILLVPGITGFIFILAGMIMKIFPPKNISFSYGYRTPSSMKNQERWDFAQRHAAVRLLFTGIALLIISLGGLLIPDFQHKDLSGLIFVLAAAVYLILNTELALKKKFGKR